MATRTRGKSCMKAITALLFLTTSAVAEPYIIKPPAQFDHAYKGKLVEIVTTWQRAASLCRSPPKRGPIGGGFFGPGGMGGGSSYGPMTGMYLSCQFFVGRECHVIRYNSSDSAFETSLISKEEIDHVRRHEIAHCNGWTDAHEGGSNW